MACLGKWTTYRSMAQDTVDRLVQVAGLEDKTGCMTDGFLLDGGEGWHPTNFIRLIQDYGIDIEVRNTKTSVPLASTIIQNLALILYLDLVTKLMWTCIIIHMINPQRACARVIVVIFAALI